MAKSKNEEYIFTKEDFEFMKVAKGVMGRSTCVNPLTRFGAIAVLNGKVIAEGWNGAVGKIPPCLDKGICIRRELNIPHGEQREIANCICAEQRIICTCARDGIALKGAVIYVDGIPCVTCVRLLAECQVKRIIYTNPKNYTAPLSYDKASRVGVELVGMKMEDLK